MSDITFQVNLSPGDIAYASTTVPRLREAHPNVTEAVAVVDCCRPQRTKIVDPDSRFPAARFRERVAHICEIARDLQVQGCFDRVVFLHPGDAVLSEWARKYLRGLVTETHDYGGCALSAYLAVFEVPSTRFVVHYDADMLIYHDGGYDWAAESVPEVLRDERVVAVSPRISPPRDGLDAPSLNEGRPLTPHRAGWLNDWFSTRCFLMDLVRLRAYLPLLHGRALLETLTAKYLNRGYPRSPEMLLFRRIGAGGGRRLNLRSEQAWLVHPTTKPQQYLDLLPRIVASVAAGHVPAAQRGCTEVDLDAWPAFLDSSPEAGC